MVYFFLSLLKRKIPQKVSETRGGGGVKATFGQCKKGSSFFQDYFPYDTAETAETGKSETPLYPNRGCFILLPD